MPLAQSLSATRTLLNDLLVEDLAMALKALKELLPEEADKHSLVLALQARLQLLNKQRITGVVDPKEYGQGLAIIRADFQAMLEGLEEVDFEPPLAKASKQPANAARQGSVLYRIPHKMPIQKATICTVRVAADTDAILEDIVLDDDVRLRERVEVSDRMSAELIDTEGNVFEITSLNAAHQKVRDSGYTQWTFRVIPKIEGEHQLMVKVSLLEFDPNTKEYVPRDISILETVNIVTEALAPADTEAPPYKSTAHSIVMGPALQPSATIRVNRGLRAIALFLAFLMLGSTATWAVTTPPERGLFFATIKAELSGDVAPLVEFIQEYKNKPEARPYLDKAYFRKADKTGDLADLREYQQEFADSGQYKMQVVEKIRNLETKAVASLVQQPDEENVRKYLQNFPDAELLPQVKQGVETNDQLATVLLPEIEAAYVRTLQVQSSAPKVEAFLRDFPQSQRLAEVAVIASAKPQVLQQVQPALEQAIVQRVQRADKPADVEKLLPAIKKVAKQDARAEIAAIVSKKQGTAWLGVQQATKEASQQADNPPAPETPKDNSATQETEKSPTAPIAVNPENKTASNKTEIPKPAPVQDADADSDGIPDKTDQCPTQYGSAKTQGCPDADDDGVADKQDKCPYQVGPARFDGCPDTDGDGIPDNLDKCPNQKGTAVEDGCPLVDRDGDGVADKLDKCPDEYGTLAYHGCPPPLSNEKLGFRPDNMIPIKGGTFQMGASDGNKNKKPVHNVSISDYFISRYEITVAEYLVFCDETKKHYPEWMEEGVKRKEKAGTESQYKNQGAALTSSNYPIIGVSWNDAVAYCQWLSKKTGKQYRLPTEAEWEYAARGGHLGLQIEFLYSGSNDIDPVAWYYSNSKGKVHPVGEKAKNQLGLFDMSGNVLEWCSDWYDAEYYQKSHPSNPKGPVSGSYRVLRGGSWLSYPQYCRIAFRDYSTPDSRSDYIGFRIARSR